MRHNKYFLSIVPAGMFFLASTAYALPFNIVPNGTLPTTVSPGGTASASYSITNITNFNPPSNLVKWLPPNVAVNLTGTTCTPTSAFRLAPNQSCILNLTVSGAVSNTDSDPRHHLFVCMSDQATCAGPTPQNSLNVTVEPGIATAYPAVGFYIASTEFPLSYTSTDRGNHWKVSAMLPPAQGVGDNDLLGVACGSNGQQCTAVGYYEIEGNNIPLSFTSKDGGNHWAVSSTLPPAQSSSDNYLTKVACSSSGQMCTAVGYYYYNFTRYIPLSYTSTNGGNTWTVSATMPPAQSTGNNFMEGVACDSTGRLCTAVGYYYNGSNYLPSAYTSTDGGNHWALSATLPPAEGSETNLNSVACSSSGQLCTAVGAYYNGTTYVPLSYTSTDGGNVWALSATLPPAQNANENYLEGVTCSSNGLQCTAVGFYYNGSMDIPLTYTSTNGGNTWAVSTGLPQAQGNGNNQAYSVSCDSSGLQCSLVGYYENNSVTTPLSFISTNGGVTWSMSATQPPAQGTDGSFVESVS